MLMNGLKQLLRLLFSEQRIDQVKLFFKKYSPSKRAHEVDALYRLLYNAVHDHDQSLDLTSRQTENAFSYQWAMLPSGQYMLSDPWFKENVQSILANEMLLIKPEWFKRKRILDAGCGNGRWSYGLAKMGAALTCVDINQVAIDETQKAIASIDVSKRFVTTPLEDLHLTMPGEMFDMVFSFGVIHHCHSFNQAFENVIGRVCEGGVLFLYLYGRESMTMEEDLDLFKDRIYYNSLTNRDERERFLLKRVGGREEYMHQMHDLLAPLVNRRLEYDDIRERLESRGFSQIERTIDSTDLFIRAFKGKAPSKEILQALLPKKSAPHWFEHHK